VTDRISLDDLNSDQLDQLYNRAEEAETGRNNAEATLRRQRAHNLNTQHDYHHALTDVYAMQRVRAMLARWEGYTIERGQPSRILDELRAAIGSHESCKGRGSCQWMEPDSTDRERAERAEGERDALIDERDKLDRKLTTMTDVARGNLKHVQSIVPDLEAATQRAERAEGERGDLLVKLASVREDRDRWRDQARTEQADRRTAEEESRRARQAEAEQRARAERAEAAIGRVRKAIAE